MWVCVYVCVGREGGCCVSCSQNMLPVAVQHQFEQGGNLWCPGVPRWYSVHLSVGLLDTVLAGTLEVLRGLCCSTHNFCETISQCPLTFCHHHVTCDLSRYVPSLVLRPPASFQLHIFPKVSLSKSDVIWLTVYTNMNENKSTNGEMCCHNERACLLADKPFCEST